VSTARCLVALGTTFVLLAGTSSTTVAVGSLAFDLEIPGPCLRGTAPAGISIELILKGPGGTPIDSTQAKAGGQGRFQTCFDRWIVGGDILVARSGTTMRRFPVPRLTVNVDRVANVVSGNAPARAALHLDVRMGPNGFLPHGHATRDSVADSAGHYAVDFSSTLDIGAGMAGEVVATVGSDVVRTYNFALWIVTQRGQSNIYGLSGGRTRIEIRAPDGHLRAQAETSGPGQYLVVLADSDGSPVYLRAGDRIIVPGVADANLLIPAGRLNADPSTDTAYGRCMPNTPFDLWIGGMFKGRTDGAGRFAMDLTGKAHTPVGKLESLFCHYPSGDIYQINSEVH
jgi:hypothetical protein